ncbi:MAG: polysaccharide deacetylase family protein [Bacteroidales bacterium]
MILIYTHKITKRVKYIFNLFFERLLEVPFELTSKPEYFMHYEGPKFNYSERQFKDELFFRSAGLLFDTGIEGQELNVFTRENGKAFYPVYEKKSAMPFDLFSASFYLVTRYEEYLPYIKDQFGRFDARQSVSLKYGFLDQPLVNIWAEELKTILSKRFVSLRFSDRKFRFIPTIDIDSAYSYKYKGTVRTTGAMLMNLSRFQINEILERFKVLTGIKKDPFDTYDFQFFIQKKYELKPIYFILFANYGKYDKNIAVHNRSFQKLVKSLADYAEVGIHPSYDSNNNFGSLKTEIERLSKVLNREVTKSRQHFLKLSFPTTYRNLINLDITDDYTMGYASEPGFRAGIADWFYFYDLDLETPTRLRVHPFQVMEGTLKDYLKLSREESLDVIKKMIDRVKAVNGTFISLWHNESLSNEKRWAGWQKVYAEMVRYALS